VIAGNSIKILEDLRFLMSNDGFNINLKIQEFEEGIYERINVFFANRGTTNWSFNCTNLKNIDKEYSVNKERVNSSDLYDSGDENVNGYKIGGFKMFINNAYDANKTVSRQPKISGSGTFDASGICAIPRNDLFSYEIYSTIDGWDWGIIIKFEDMTFFSFFGDKSKGTDLMGNYSISSFPIGSARVSIPYNFNNELGTISSGATPISPFQGVGAGHSIFFCHYTDINRTEIKGGYGSINVVTSSGGEIYQNAPKGIYNNFYNEYSGLSQIINLEFYGSDADGERFMDKKLYDLDFGYANLNKANSLDIKTINGERIKFIVNGRKEKVMNIENRASYNNLIFWFKVK
jgi:hypothetical protein